MSKDIEDVYAWVADHREITRKKEEEENKKRGLIVREPDERQRRACFQLDDWGQDRKRLVQQEKHSPNEEVSIFLLFFFSLFI